MTFEKHPDFLIGLPLVITWCNNILYVLTGLRNLPLFFLKILQSRRVTCECLTSSRESRSICLFVHFPRSKIFLHAFIFLQQLTMAAERTSDVREKK